MHIMDIEPINLLCWKPSQCLFVLIQGTEVDFGQAIQYLSFENRILTKANNRKPEEHKAAVSEIYSSRGGGED